ncbi:MAG: ATP synthase F0 subunit C [Candidatus Omnitrophica bacterium]|nr:ATP synthase F0 subunit C [Candidatus Omnitrophota bacterium]
MTASQILAFSLPFGLAVTALASAFGLGRAVAAAMDATARQPEASTKILVNMMAGCALIEALTLYALVFGFSLMGKI